MLQFQQCKAWESTSILMQRNSKFNDTVWSVIENFPKHGFVVINLRVFGDNGSNILGPGEF